MLLKKGKYIYRGVSNQNPKKLRKRRKNKKNDSKRKRAAQPPLD
jgi:hypothetical protein